MQIGGPTGAFIVVVFGVIAQHGYDGLVLATFMAGIILIIAGYFRAGNLIAFVPEAVINGFTIGIGIIIASSQIGDFLGLTIAEIPADFLEKIPVLWEARESFSLPSFGIAVMTLILIVLLRRLYPRFPGLIVAVGVGSAFVALLGLPVDTLFFPLRRSAQPDAMAATARSFALADDRTAAIRLRHRLSGGR